MGDNNKYKIFPPFPPLIPCSMLTQHSCAASFHAHDYDPAPEQYHSCHPDLTKTIIPSLPQTVSNYYCPVPASQLAFSILSPLLHDHNLTSVITLGHRTSHSNLVPFTSSLRSQSLYDCGVTLFISYHSFHHSALQLSPHCHLITFYHNICQPFQFSHGLGLSGWPAPWWPLLGTSGDRHGCA